LIVSDYGFLILTAFIFLIEKTQYILSHERQMQPVQENMVSCLHIPLSAKKNSGSPSITFKPISNIRNSSPHMLETSTSYYLEKTVYKIKIYVFASIFLFLINPNV
jgi:hypothetical protein